MWDHTREGTLRRGDVKVRSSHPLVFFTDAEATGVLRFPKSRRQPPGVGQPHIARIREMVAFQLWTNEPTEMIVRDAASLPQG
jgi:hypothetical protein